MAKTKTIRVSEDELAAVQAFRKAQGEQVYKEPDVQTETLVTDAQRALADAFVSAIERTRPPEKKTVANRKPRTPWTPPDGTPQLKLKRKMLHHGMTISDRISNDEIDLLNKVRPGHYCDGFVRVTLRKDRGLDIDHPIRTSSQRLKLVNTYGVRSFTELLQRIVDEKANPTKYRKPEDADFYDLD